MLQQVQFFNRHNNYCYKRYTGSNPPNTQVRVLTSLSRGCLSQTTPVLLSTAKYLMASSPTTPYTSGSSSGSTALSWVTEEPGTGKGWGVKHSVQHCWGNTFWVRDRASMYQSLSGSAPVGSRLMQCSGMPPLWPPESAFPHHASAWSGVQLLHHMPSAQLYTKVQ